MTVTRLSLLASAIGLMAGGSARAAEVEHLRTVGSSVAVDVGRALGDVVVVDSILNVEGVVRGHIFAVDSQVFLKEQAVVLGSVTVNRGRLTIKPGAVLPKMVYLNDAGFLGPNGEAIDFGETITLGEDAATTVSLDRTVVSTVSVSLMKEVLPFSRFVPDPKATVKSLRNWHPGVGLELRRAIRAPKELMVGGVAKLTFVSSKVRGAFQRGYRGKAGTVLVTAVHLQDQRAAASLWKQLEDAGERSKVRLSVKSGLGDGAHWFFKRRNRYCMMWQRGSWLIAVETRLAQRDAKLFQQTQFSNRVLRSLELKLSQRPALSRGVQP